MSKTSICSLELMSHSDLSRISHRPGAISQVFGLLPLFFALPRLSCGHTDTLSDYSHSSFWHSLLCLQNQPLNWHDTSQFFSFVPKRGSLGGEAKGAAGVCFLQLVLVLFLLQIPRLRGCCQVLWSLHSGVGGGSVMWLRWTWSRCPPCAPRRGLLLWSTGKGPGDRVRKDEMNPANSVEEKKASALRFELLLITFVDCGVARIWNLY